MDMVKLTIDGREVRVERGATVLEAGRKLGIEIPTMCYRDGYRASTSCTVCVVRINGADGFVPSCGTVAVEGMRVESESEDVHQARRTALELLLSDHVGDCMGPCQVSCPAKMEIPLMIWQIAADKLGDAIRTVKKDIALPAAMGRICPAPCQRICRRGKGDSAVSICLLKRYVADADLAGKEPFVPVYAETKDKTVVVVGAGPAGLTAAYYLAQKGYACTVYDEQDKPGGGMRDESLKEKLPADVLDAEVATLLKNNVELKSGVRVGADVSWRAMRDGFDAMFIATGTMDADGAEELSLVCEKDAVRINRATYETNIEGVFAGGNVAGPKRHLAIRAVADGKEAAESIDQYLSGVKVIGPVKPFNSRMGKLLPGEIEVFMADVGWVGGGVDVGGVGGGVGDGFDRPQAIAEANRCLHCDCRKADNCRLRDYSHDYGALTNVYKSERRLFVRHTGHTEVVYEPGKCIDCGLCIQTAAQHGEELGLTFVGRGFDVRVAVPFDRSIEQGLRRSGRACVENCPTGALSLKSD